MVMVPLHHKVGLQSRRYFCSRAHEQNLIRQQLSWWHILCVRWGWEARNVSAIRKGWKKMANISTWEQAKTYHPSTRLSCRKTFRLDLKLFWVKRKAIIEVNQNMWVKTIEKKFFMKEKNVKSLQIYIRAVRGSVRTMTKRTIGLSRVLEVLEAKTWLVFNLL